jgi:integrase
MAESQVPTIKDLLDAAGLKESQISYQRVVQVFALDEPMTAMKNPDRLTELDTLLTKGDGTRLTTAQNKLNAMAKFEDKVPTIFGQGGKAKSLKLGSAFQNRESAKFKEVPPSGITLKEITGAIAEIEDPNVRAAIAFNSLVPIRAGEVAQLKISDIDFEGGGFAQEYTRGMKTRNKLDLPDFAMEILREQKKVAEANGWDHLFFDSSMTKSAKPHEFFRGRMTKAINAPGGLQDRLAPYERIMDRKIAGAKDIRKLVPSILASEMGFGKEASVIMGHTSFDAIMDSVAKMSGDYYISGIADMEGGNVQLQALRALESKYAEVMGVDSVNKLAGSMNLNLPALTAEGARKIPVIRQGESISSAPKDIGPMTPEDLADIESRRELANVEIERKTTEAKAAELKARKEYLAELKASESELVEGEILEQKIKEQKANIKKQAKAELSAEKDAKPALSDDAKKGLKNAFSSLVKGGKGVLKATGVGLVATEIADAVTGGYDVYAATKEEGAAAGVQEATNVAKELSGLGMVEDVVGAGVEAGMEKIEENQPGMFGGSDIDILDTLQSGFLYGGE